MFPQYIRFYGYTAEQALNELAKTFFALVNAMYRLEAQEAIKEIRNTSVAYTGGSEGDKIVSELNKQAKGIHGIVQEVRNIKK